MANKGPTNREQIFAELARHPEGVTAAHLRKKFYANCPSSGELGIILRGEVRAKRFAFSEEEVDGRDVVYYTLSSKGRVALKKGTVVSDSIKLKLVALGRTREKDLQQTDY